MTVALTGIAILVVSAVGATLLARRPAPEKQGQTKILLFALYFWVLAFAQLIIVAIAYSVIAG